MTPQEITEAFVANVRRLLAKNGWDQKTFAAKLGTKEPHVSRLLNAKRPPKIETISKLSELFGIEPAELLAAPKRKK